MTAADDRIVVGGNDIGNPGTYDFGSSFDPPDAKFDAVFDIKESKRKAIKAKTNGHHSNKDCAMIRDFRDLLSRENIDTDLIATGPNWHGTMASFAARAGRNIYCEKPCTKNTIQSLQLADTMRRTGAVFQGGGGENATTYLASL